MIGIIEFFKANSYIIAQLIGFLGLGLIILSYMNNSQKMINFFQIFSGICFTIHFFILGAYTGALLNAIGAVRAAFFCNRDKKWMQSPIILVAFMALFLTAGILTWDSPLSLLPVIAMLLGTVSLWIKNPTLVRFVGFPGSPCWMIYNIFNGSISGVMTEAFVMSSMIVAMIRFDLIPYLRKKKQAK